MKLYLDNCCFNRPFDDQSQLRIRLETEAKLKIQELICSKSYNLTWSYILDYENNQNPFKERKEQISKWRTHAFEDIVENQSIINEALKFNKSGFKKFDSLHLACAVYAKVDYFLTTDDFIIKKASLINNICITDPIGFIKEVLL